MPRPDKPRFAATRVIKGSRVLTAGEKLVWLEDYALDLGPEGAWLAPDKMGERLGMKLRTIEDYRQRLANAGLHESAPRPGAKSKSWFAVLPVQFVPNERPGEEDVNHIIRLFDDYLRDRGFPRRSSGPNSDSRRAQTTLDLRQSSGSNPDNRRGQSPPELTSPQPIVESESRQSSGSDPDNDRASTPTVVGVPIKDEVGGEGGGEVGGGMGAPTSLSCVSNSPTSSKGSEDPEVGECATHTRRLENIRSAEDADLMQRWTARRRDLGL